MKKLFWNKRRVFLLLIFVSGLSLIALNYFLPIGSGNWNNNQIIKIKKSKTSHNFSFAVLGDNKNGYGTFDEILKNIDSNKFLFALDNGDLVYGGRKIQYRIFYNMIADQKTPFLTSLGNHDTDNGGIVNYNEIFGRRYYSFYKGKSLFVILDDSDKAGVDKAQLKWAEKELQRDFANKFVFLHVPPFDPTPQKDHLMEDASKAKSFMNLMKKYKVDIVFNSHIHGFYDLKKQGVRYIITGGAGSELFDLGSKHSFYNYVRVDVAGEKIKTRVIKFPSPENNFSRISNITWLSINSFGVDYGISLVLILSITLLVCDFVMVKNDY